jgi:hypothetical protein
MRLGDPPATGRGRQGRGEADADAGAESAHLRSIILSLIINYKEDIIAMKFSSRDRRPSAPSGAEESEKGPKFVTGMYFAGGERYGKCFPAFFPQEIYLGNIFHSICPPSFH